MCGEERPLVSVIMSVFNEQKYLKESLTSILNQSIRNIEIIIIDDCSTDKTVELIRNFRDDRIRLIQNEKNQGLTKNLNKGLKIAKGKYIARMDGDDISKKNRFEEQIKYLEMYPEKMLISCRTETFGAENMISTLQGESEELKIMMLLRPVFAHPGFMMRSELVKEKGYYYDESFKTAQDYNFAVRVAEKFEIGITPQVLLRYRVHSKQISNRNAGSQNVNADRTREYQLSKLNIHWNETQDKVYRKWINEEKTENIYDFIEAQKMIEIMINANKIKQYYSIELMEPVLKKMLYQWIIRTKSIKNFMNIFKVVGLKRENILLFLNVALNTFKNKTSQRK